MTDQTHDFGATWPITDFVVGLAHTKRVNELQGKVNWMLHIAKRWPRDVTAVDAVLVRLLQADLARAIEDQERHKSSLTEAPPQQERTA